MAVGTVSKNTVAAVVVVAAAAAAAAESRQRRDVRGENKSGYLHLDVFWLAARRGALVAAAVAAAAAAVVVVLGLGMMNSISRPFYLPV